MQPEKVAGMTLGCKATSAQHRHALVEAFVLDSQIVANYTWSSLSISFSIGFVALHFTKTDCFVTGVHVVAAQMFRTL